MAVHASRVGPSIRYVEWYCVYASRSPPGTAVALVPRALVDDQRAFLALVYDQRGCIR